MSVEPSSLPPETLTGGAVLSSPPDETSTT
jgi:hypothetical protein